MIFQHVSGRRYYRFMTRQREPPWYSQPPDYHLKSVSLGFAEVIFSNPSPLFHPSYTSSKHKKHSLHLETIMASRIQASTILTYPLGGPLLRREHGVNPPRAGEAVCNAWASGLEKTTLVRAPRTILSFAIDKLTGAFLMACDCRPSNPSNPSSLQYVLDFLI